MKPEGEARAVVSRVLRAAGRYERFFDLSEIERTEWLLCRAFEFGRKAGRADIRPIPVHGGYAARRLSA